MWDFATMHGFTFYRTPRDIDRAVSEGKLVSLDGDASYALTQGVGFSYATREAKQFVVSFAPQYAAACGAPLVVTSAARPTSRQPRNSNPYSVHPTGIAVDLRRPPAGPCQTWLRKALAELEAQGYVEATEERHPVHLHVAVLTEPGKIAALPPLDVGMLTGSEPQAQRGSMAAAPGSTPAVRVSNSTARAGASDVHIEPAAGYAVAEEGGLVVALETALSPELVAEGLAREVVRRVQDLRKDAGLRVEDRIRVRYAGAAQVETAIETFAETIGRETLARAIERSSDSYEHAWRGDVDGLVLAISLERVGA